MSTDSQRSVVGIGEVVSDPPVDSIRVEDDPELARLLKVREAEIQRIVAQQKPELIQQGVEAYKRDLTRLLAENRYVQQVAYRGNELIAYAATYLASDESAFVTGSILTADGGFTINAGRLT